MVATHVLRLSDLFVLDITRDATDDFANFGLDNRQLRTSLTKHQMLGRI